MRVQRAETEGEADREQCEPGETTDLAEAEHLAARPVVEPGLLAGDRDVGRDSLEECEVVCSADIANRLITSTTPMLPARVRKGAHRIARVVIPVAWSMPG